MRHCKKTLKNKTANSRKKMVKKKLQLKKANNAKKHASVKHMRSGTRY